MAAAPLTLVIATPSPFARKARVALIEKGIAFDVQIDNPWSPGARAPVHNPLGKIPVLLTPDGGAIFDSKVILGYLEAKWPRPALFPADPLARVAARQIEAIADGVCDAVVLIVLERARHADLQSCDWIARQQSKVEAGVADVAHRLAGRDWYVGDALGVADIAVGCMLGYLDLRLPEFAWRDHAPGLVPLQHRLMERESFRLTVPSAQPIAAPR